MTAKQSVNRCLWCGVARGDLTPLPHRKEYEGALTPTHTPIWACPEHAERADGYLVERAARSIGTLVGFLLVAVLVVVGGATGRDSVAALGVLVCGLWCVAFPYATPESVRRFGVVNSRFLVRWLGGFLVTVGAAWLGFTLLASVQV